MNKFVKFCKKPLCVIASVLIVVFTALLVFVSCQTRGNEYRYKISMLGITMEQIVEFKDNENVTMSFYINNQLETEQEYLYKIKNGGLYVYQNSFEEEGVYQGTINAYEIVLTADESEVEEGFNMKIALVCGLHNSLKIVSIVMIVLGGICLVTSILVMALHKNKAIYQDTQTPTTQQVEQPTQPKCPYCGVEVSNQDICPNCNAKL